MYIDDINYIDFYYIIEDIKNNTDDVIDKYNLSFLYDILKRYYTTKNIDNIYNGVTRYYLILNISNKREENINKDYYDKYVYVYQNNKITVLNGNINYKNVIFNPVLYFYETHKYYSEIRKNINNNLFINITYQDIVDSFNTTIYKNIDDEETILNFIIDLEGISSYNHKLLQRNNLLKYKLDSFKKIGGYKNTKFITNGEHLFDYRLFRFNDYLKLMEADKMYIIRKYFNSEQYNRFLKKYEIYKNIETALSTEENKKLITLLKDEENYKDKIFNNKCEHVQLIKEKQYDIIIKYYIQERFEYHKLHLYTNWFTCVKCNLPLICPHTVVKHLQPDISLNNFVAVTTNNTKAVSCKICNEILWRTEHVDNKLIFMKQDTTLLSLLDTDNVDLMIYRVVKNYFVNRNVLTLKKTIMVNQIVKFVNNHIKNEVEIKFNEMNKNINQEESVSYNNKLFLLYIYVLCSLMQLVMINNKSLMIFSKKVNKLEDVMPNMIMEIKTTFKNMISKSKEENIEKMIRIIYNKLYGLKPYNFNLVETDINMYKKRLLHTHTIFKFILTINKLFYNKLCKIENVLNIDLSDIEFNYSKFNIPVDIFNNLNLEEIKKINESIKKDNAPINIYNSDFYNNLSYNISMYNKQNINKTNNDDKKDKIITYNQFKYVIEFVLSTYLNSVLKHNNKFIELKNRLLEFIKNNDIKLIYKNIYNNFIIFTKYIDSKNTFSSYHYDLYKKYTKSYDGKYDKFNINEVPIIKSTNKNVSLIFNIPNVETQLKNISNLIDNKINYINIYSVLIVIVSDFNNTENPSNRISYLEKKHFKDLNKLYVKDNLYETLLNIKNNVLLKKYYTNIVNYIIRLNDLNNNTTNTFNKQMTINMNQISSEENIAEDEKVQINEKGVVNDFNYENFDYEDEYSDEDVNIKDAE